MLPINRLWKKTPPNEKKSIVRNSILFISLSNIFFVFLKIKYVQMQTTKNHIFLSSVKLVKENKENNFAKCIV